MHNFKVFDYVLNFPSEGKGKRKRATDDAANTTNTTTSAPPTKKRRPRKQSKEELAESARAREVFRGAKQAEAPEKKLWDPQSGDKPKKGEVREYLKSVPDAVENDSDQFPSDTDFPEGDLEEERKKRERKEKGKGKEVARRVEEDEGADGHEGKDVEMGGV